MGARFFPNGNAAFFELQPDDHIALLYENEKDHWRFLSPFLQHFLGKKSTVAYFTSLESEHTTRRHLHAYGFTPTETPEAGRVQVFGLEDSDPCFHFRSLLAWIENETSMAFSNTPSSFCVLVDMNWALRETVSDEMLRDFEQRIAAFTKRTHSILVCQYDTKLFSPQRLQEVMIHHPLIATGSELYDNFFYRPTPATLPNGRRGIDEMLSRLGERKELENALEETTWMNDILLDTLPCIAIMLHPDGEVITCNRFAQQSGLSPGEKCYESWRGDETPCPKCRMAEAMKTGREIRDEIVGNDSAWEAAWVPIPPDLCLCCLFDITKQKQAEHALRRSEQNYRSLVECASDGICIAQDGIVKYINWSFAQMIGYGHIEILGQPFPFAVPTEEQPFLLEEYERCMDGRGCGYTFESVMIRKDGKRLHVEASGGPTIYEERPAELLLVRDITARKRIERKLVYEATHDALTGILNRQSFMDAYGALFQETQRRGGNFTFCMCDIDEFKQVNERYGHPIGDKAITQFAEILRDELRDADIVGRYGGDEFGILFQNAAPAETIRPLLRIRERCQTTIFHETGQTRLLLSATFGLAEFEHYPDTETELLDAADEALRLGKQAGRDQVILANGTEIETLLHSGTPTVRHAG